MSKTEKSGHKIEPSSTDDAKYIIKVKTGSVKNASTDSTVSITIFGNKLKTDKIQLKTARMPGKLFEKSRTDEFHITAKHVGQVMKAKFFLSSKG